MHVCINGKLTHNNYYYMKIQKIILATLVALSPLALSAQWVNTTQGKGDSVDKGRYACALISNGRVSTQIDNLGVQKQQRYVSFIPHIAWQGRRLAGAQAPLIRFGYFDTLLTVDGKVQGKPEKWEQSLNNKEAYSRNVVEYDEATVETIAFVPMQYDMVVVKKIITPKKESTVKFEFIYNFASKSIHKDADNVFIKKEMLSANRAAFEYRAIGHYDFNGIIAISSDFPSAPSFPAPKVAELSSEAKASPKNPLEITYFITLNDDFKKLDKVVKYIVNNSDIKRQDYVKNDKESVKLIAEKGFKGIFDEHKAGWAKYWEGSYINIPNKEIEKTYYTGLYHQRCNSTEWSLPVGVFADSHWNGLYFGWDEAFNAMSLATSGKFEDSRKPSDFRTSILRVAMFRANKGGGDNTIRKYGCRFNWEVLEDGFEGSPFGFWIDHIFHMSNMVMQTWGHYLYSNDKDFLKKNYELMVESCLFYINHAVYNNDGKYTIGKCTDLERMGPAKENPFMTSCGVIYTLEKTAAAADVLGKDEELAAEFRRIASELRKTLPNDGEKYVPYPGSKDYSIGSVGGYYPYQTIKEGDEMGKKAVYEFHKNINKGGNMYAMGKGVNAWYAGWMSSALVNFNDTEIPAQLLDDASKETGAFYDTYEINEPHNKVQRCPWFSTGSGNYVYAVNQMLVRPKENGEIMICTSTPIDWKDIDFYLPVYGGLWVKADIKAGKLVSISLEAKGLGENGEKRTIVIPSRFVDKAKIIGKYKEENGYVRIDAEAGKQFYK